VKSRADTPVPHCEHTVEGNPSGPTLVFIHGWPDDASLWRKQVPVLAPDYRCVLITLPNFGREHVRAGGFDFPELVEMIASTIRTVQAEGRVHLVTHDWGAYIGYVLEQTHPEMIESMIALDIGGHLGRPDIRSALMIAGYQKALIMSWLVGGLIPPLGNLMTKTVGRVVRVPSRQRAGIRSRYNYSYFYLWRGLILPWKRSSILGRYRPQCPVLYLYGERKPVMFHSRRWLEIVSEQGGRTEGIPSAGHWFMETHPEIVNERISAWLARLA
jgi:pimeloyl-ACP methyl ester carboxylesterase